MAQIRLENLNKRFVDFVAVRNTNMVINNGEFFVLLGPSGCGKTTTLRMIAGLELPTEGKILLDNDDVTFLRAAQRDIAFVFQLFALYPHMNVKQNLMFPLENQGMSRAEINKRLDEVAKLLRIDHLLKNKISSLAGGDRQRVALGRAIIRRPKAFLMDEPLGTLDAEFRELMCAELRALHDRIQATTVYVTHDQLEAMVMADKIAVMNKGEVLQVASPLEIYRRPATKFVAKFIGSPAMNFLDAQQGISSGADTIKIQGSDVTIPKLHEGTPASLTLGVRPEDIEVSSNGLLRGEVFGVEYMGSRQLLTIDTSAGRLKVKTSNDVHATIGDNLGLNFRTENLIVFDNETDNALPSQLMDAPLEVVTYG
ncbi:MAG: ABC transporter ATP-binding protein [Trueperaceae bacterium]